MSSATSSPREAASQQASFWSRDVLRQVMEVRIDEQRGAIFEAMGLILAAGGLFEKEFNIQSDEACAIDSTLSVAHRMLKDIADKLEAAYFTGNPPTSDEMSAAEGWLAKLVEVPGTG